MGYVPCWCVDCEGKAKPARTENRHRKKPRFTAVVPLQDEGHLPPNIHAPAPPEPPVPPALVDSSEDGDSSPDNDTIFAHQVIDTVANNNVNLAGANAFLKAMLSCYGTTLREAGHDPPSSMYRAEKLAKAFKSPARYIPRDFCPKCGWCFPVDADVRTCRRCSSFGGTTTRCDPATRKPWKQAYYLDVEQKIQSIFSSKYLFSQLQYFKEPRPRGSVADEMADRELTDVWDGEVLERLFHNYEGPGHEKKNQFLYFSLCADGVEVKKRQDATYTPVTAKLLNWPPALRRLNTTIFLLAFFPPNVIDYGEMMSPIADTFALHQPGGTAIPVSIKTRREEAWLMLVNAISDIRGIPVFTGGSHPPCKVGSCNNCKVRGFRASNRTVLAGAVRGLGVCVDDELLRTAYGNEFWYLTELNKYSEDFWPKTRKPIAIVEEGEARHEASIQQIVEQKAKQTISKRRAKFAYHTRDPFSSKLPYWNVHEQTTYDSAHEHSNLVKQIFGFMLNNGKKSKSTFPPGMRLEEARIRKSMKRYQKPEGKNWPIADWQADVAGKQRIDALHTFCPVPKEWPPVRKYKAHAGFVKCSEWILLAGDAGCYVLRASGIRGNVLGVWIELLRILERMMRKVSTPGDRQYVEAHLPRVLTRCEMCLPLAWSTSVVHLYQCVAVATVKAVGPFPVNNMLDSERYHTVFRRRARATFNVMAAVKHQAEIAEMANTFNTDNRSLRSARSFLRSSAAGHQVRHDSKNKSDRVTRPLGKPKNATVTEEELAQLNSLWQQLASGPGAEPLPGAASTNRRIHQYERVEYGGFQFTTEEYQQTKRTKLNSTHLRLDYIEERVRGGRGSRQFGERINVRKTVYGTVLGIFEHEFVPGGVGKMVLRCRWFNTVGKCPVAGTILVQDTAGEDPRDRFTFLETAYQIPVAVWPHDKRSNAPRVYASPTFDIIDRNQEQYNSDSEGANEDENGFQDAELLQPVNSEQAHMEAVAASRKRNRGEQPRESKEVEDSKRDESESESESESEGGELPESDSEGESAYGWGGSHDAECGVCYSVPGQEARYACPLCPRVFCKTCVAVLPHDRTAAHCQNDQSLSKACSMLSIKQGANGDLGDKDKARLAVCTSRLYALERSS